MSAKNGAVKRKSTVRITAQRDNAVITGSTTLDTSVEMPTRDVATMAREFGFTSEPLPDAMTSVGPASIPCELRPLPKVKKIAIVGKAPSSIELAPYADPEWEIWGLSDLMLHKCCTRWTRWFELHDPEGWHPDDKCPRRQKWHPEYWKHLCKQYTDGRVVYVREPHPEMPHAVRFPHEVLIDKYSLRDKSGRPKPYFTNTVSWLIAFALEEGATHLSIYGVDMAQQEKGVKSEYAYQRPSVEAFIGMAMMKLGVKNVYVPDEADLMRAVRLYGIDALSPAMRAAHKKRKKDLANLRQQAEQELAQAQHTLREKENRLHVIAGAQDDNDQWWGQQVM